ncbi:MAG: efflux RND transporter permease subunit, partial [candidate division KSB1 bacterium]|nr:efflux RND transporter permease subunit [candidate division KSB1 bacterium]
VTVLMFVLAVFLLGYISFSRLSVELFPDLNNPRLFVEIKAGERPPEEIEKQFVRSIESLAIRQKKVVQVSSVSRVGSALITVEYAWETDMDEAFLDLQKALASFSQNSSIDEINISQLDPNADPVVTLALWHPQITDMDELRRTAENYLRNELVRLEGIADVELLGEEEKEVVIETDGYLLKAYGLTPSQVANRISQYNRNISGGSITEMGRRYVIKGVSEFTSLEDIGNIILTYTQPQDMSGQPIPGQWTPVFLRDAATIKLQNKDPENIVHVNGRRCIALAIYKETRFNTVKAVDVVLKELDQLRRALPGYELVVIQNQGEFVTAAINEVKQAALFGVLLATAVLYLFLRRIGATLVIALAIPISIIATFNLMYFNGLTLNIMTLGGLALGAGMLVDNAIVVVENIMRRMEKGESAVDASVEGAAQVGGAVTAATLTTIVVFLPIVYLHGIAGELFKDQALTVAFSLISSLLVAMLVIPMMTSRMPGMALGLQNTMQFTFYRDALRNIISRPWRYILLGAAITVAALMLLPVVGSEFFPKTESNEISIDVKLPEGTDLMRTEAAVRNLEEIIQELAGESVETIYSVVGPSSRVTSAESFRDENTAVITLTLKKQRPFSSAQIMQKLDAAFAEVPDIEFQFRERQTALQTFLSSDEAPIMVQVRGDDLETLRGLCEQLRGELATIDGLFNVRTGFDEDREEVNVKLDRVRAGLLGVSIDQVVSGLQNHLSGTQAAEWENNGELQDITLRLERVSLHEIPAIELAANSQRIRIDDIADVTIERVPKEIRRINQSRVGLVTAQIIGKRPFDQIVRDIEKAAAKLELPPEYRVQIGGEEQRRRESFHNLRFALLLSVLLVYMVMASQFESLVHPFTILLTIPLALSGTVFAFLLFGKPLNIMAFIGLILLGGIAVNNSIILVDTINQLKQAGMPVREAIVEAGQRRIRPILMTSLTTILGLLPLSFGVGQGAALRQPLAIAVIGGLLTSTLLTLIVIPCVYLKLDRFSRK